MATFNYNKVNLAAAQIPSAITASQTSITVDVSESALFPTVPFFATIMPAGGIPNTLNSEIVQVTAKNTSTGVLTITRAQRGTTAKAQDEGAVIMNGVYIEDLAQAQAVGLAFFSATNTSVSSSYSYWNIDSAMLPTEPTNGMSIRVVFGANTSSPAARLRLNGGTYRDVYAGVGLTATASNVNMTTLFRPRIDIIYELVYYNGAWYAMNVPANNSITSSSIDSATLGAKYETTISGYIPIGDTAIKNIGYFTASPNRLYILRFGGGPWVSKATGIWRARTGSYSGSVFSSSVMIAPDASGIYESSTSPILFVQGSTSSNIYLTFQPYQSAEWSVKCDVYSIEAMT